MPFSDFNTLSEAQAYTTYILQNADTLREYLMLKGKWDRVIAPSLDTNSLLFNAASGIVYKVNKEQPISFNPNTANGAAHITMLNSFVPSDLTAIEVDEILALATEQPFSNATQSQFNAAKGIFTAKQIAFTAGKDIVVTLNAALTEKVAVTTWRVEADFEDENAGRTAYVQTAQKYRINMQGKKSGNYELRIPLVGADFSVELI